MRVFWLTLLMAGLVLVTADVYDAAQSEPTEAVPCLMDDGSGIPNPNPTPVTK